MRVRQLRGLLHRLKALQIMKLSSKNLLLKLGEAKARYRAAWRLFDFDLPEAKSQDKAATFGFRLNRKKLREARRREGRYLLRTNLCKRDPVELASTSNWSKLKPSSKALRTISVCVPSSIGARIASKPISLSRFWPTACT